MYMRKTWKDFTLFFDNCTRTHFDSNLPEEMPKRPRNDRPKQAAAVSCRWLMSCWMSMSGCLCRPGSLPALSTPRSVPGVLNPKQIRLLLLSAGGGPVCLTNDQSPPEGKRPLFSSFPRRILDHFLWVFNLFFFFFSELVCTSSSDTGLVSFHRLISLHRQHAISFPLAVFIVGDLRSIYKSRPPGRNCAWKCFMVGVLKADEQYEAETKVSYYKTACVTLEYYRDTVPTARQVHVKHI